MKERMISRKKKGGQKEREKTWERQTETDGVR